jgi:hypothetical protein
MSNHVDIAKAVSVIAAAYPSFNPSKETVEVYYQLLRDLDADEIQVATLYCCAEDGRKFAPSVGEIRGAAKLLRGKAAGIPSAFEAWQEVCDAPKSGETKRATEEKNEDGAWIIEVTKYKWSHPLVERTASLLGWPDFPGDNTMADRAHFLKAYDEQFGNSAQNEMQLPMIADYIEKRRKSLPQPISKLLESK